MADLGVWTVDGDAPRSVSRSGVGFEQNLEDWIANDSSLLADGLTIVGRQVRLDGGPLDLLAIDLQERWVVIELKRERLYRAALAQALDYASSIGSMGSDALEQLLRPGLQSLGDADALSRAVRQQLDSEREGREVAVLLAGVGVDAGLERIVDHLGGYGVPISIVSFEVFAPEGGPRLFIREVTDEETRPPSRPQHRRRSVDDIRDLAREVGVEAQFDRFLTMSQDAGLAVRPYTRSVMIAPPTARNRYLMLARPERGGIYMHAGPEKFAEFFPPLTEADATAAIGPFDPRRTFKGPDLDARLDQIEAFLQTLSSADEDGDED